MDRGHSCTKQQIHSNIGPFQPNILSAAKYRTNCPGRILQRALRVISLPPPLACALLSLQPFSGQGLPLFKQADPQGPVQTGHSQHCTAGTGRAQGLQHSTLGAAQEFTQSLKQTSHVLHF